MQGRRLELDALPHLHRLLVTMELLQLVIQERVGIVVRQQEVLFYWKEKGSILSSGMQTPCIRAHFRPTGQIHQTPPTHSITAKQNVYVP